MSEATKILSHQGKDLRLSLPINDCRQEQEKSFQNLKLLQPCGIEIEQPATFQTIEIPPDNCDDSEMRVICSLSNRIQWDQHVNQIKERKLRELGVGAVQNRPAIATTVHKPRLNSFSSASRNMWMGLHTPAVSTASSIASHLPIQPAAFEPGEKALAESLTAQVEALRARHHQLSQSVSQLASTGSAVSIPARELVHRRLSSIAPVIVRHGSRVVSGIGSIKEESENVEDEPLMTEPDTQVLQPIARDPTAFHQHLASHDMSELIKPRQNLLGDLYLPDFGTNYQTFQWADEPMDSDALMFAPFNSSMFQQQEMMGFDFEPVYMQPPIADVSPAQHASFPMQYCPQNLGSYVNPATHDAATVLQSQDHVPRKSSLNLGAREFVPFSQAVVRPTPGSQAIPIVRPGEDPRQLQESQCHGAEVSRVTPQHSLDCDAYDGFDSSSDVSSSGSQHGPTVMTSTMEEVDNEHRVKSFKFPSPCKSGQATPLRPRTDLFNSASPDGAPNKLLNMLPTPKMSSTPHKTTKIFQKSVTLGDNELDSIIMDLSVREAPARCRAKDSGSEEDSQAILFDEEPEDYTAPIRPTLQRTASAKLLLSHEDTDVGLLLDAMLSAKFASISDALTGVQGTVGNIEEQVCTVARTLARSQVEPPVWHAEFSASLVSQDNEEVTEFHRQIKNYEPQSAEMTAETENLRQELWSALSKAKQTKAADLPIEVQAKSSGHQHVACTSAGETASADNEDRLRRLEMQLQESTAFCSALQSQYTASELALTKLKKELSDVQLLRDQTLAKVEEMDERYEQLQQVLHETAAQYADEQSHWRNVSCQKEAQIEELMRRLDQEQGMICNDELTDKRRESSVSSEAMGTDSQLMQYMMDRVKALEYSNTHIQSVHKQELEIRDNRLHHLLTEWKQMTQAVASAECTIDGLRAEVVLNADFEDRLVQDLDRAHNLIDALTAQLGKAGPVGILKRSKSASEVRNESLADQAIVRLNTEVQQRDATIVKLEALLKKPAESTERQILSTISENIANSADRNDGNPTEALCDDSSEAQKLQAARVAELKRIRMSWELNHAPRVADAVTISRLASGKGLEM